ncbi:MAG: tRNA 2-thiouridine(34) synthase MnmA [Bacteroidaceae bacterium]|nr:tRNA 2-thiouridine(34) synthase MnmA [Bacteroidaceae bacterium]
MNTCLLLSGGVDSAVALHLLMEQGIEPDLYYIKIGMDDDADLTCTAEEDLEMCRALAHRYGRPLEVIDLQQEYWDRVVSYTMDHVRRGLTPNPDVMCNRLIKFGAFEEKAGHQYARIATGHYAQVLEENGQRWLATAPDPVKDQTDFLAQLEGWQMQKIMLPIGHLMKADVRRIAEEQHLAPAHRKDSQGICFLGKINYNDFVRRFLGERPGPVIDIETGRKIGEHRGYWFHTIGQRKGLGFGGGPWFVVKKDIEENILYVSHGFDTVLQYGRSFHLRDFHFLTGDPFPQEGTFPITFKVRHTDRWRRGTLTRTAPTADSPEGVFHIEGEERIQGIAPGQFGVIYTPDAKICVGSGEISVG